MHCIFEIFGILSVQIPDPDAIRNIHFPVMGFFRIFLMSNFTQNPFL